MFPNNIAPGDSLGYRIGWIIPDDTASDGKKYDAVIISNGYPAYGGINIYIKTWYQAIM